MPTVEIYGLVDPTTNEVRYIGKAVSAKRRFAGHLRERRASRQHYPVYCWINSLKQNGLLPKLAILKTVDENDWQRVEIKTIKQYKRKGCRLLNVAEGGDAPHVSIEVRAANGRKVALAIHSDSQRKRLWAVKRALGEAIRWLRNNGRGAHADEIIAKLAKNNIYLGT